MRSNEEILPLRLQRRGQLLPTQKHQTVATRKKNSHKESGTEYSVPRFAIQYSQGKLPNFCTTGAEVVTSRPSNSAPVGYKISNRRSSRSVEVKIVPPFFSSVHEPRALNVIPNGVYYDILFFRQKPLDFFCLAYYNKL